MAFHQSTDVIHQQQMQQQQQQQLLQQQQLQQSQASQPPSLQQASSGSSTTNLLGVGNSQANALGSSTMIVGGTVVMGGSGGNVPIAQTMVTQTSQSNLGLVSSVGGVVQRTNYPLSRFQLPLIFLSEVAFEIGEEFRKHLPTLLQLIFLGLYYHQQPVHEHCRLLLLNLIRCLVIKKCQQNGDTNTMLYEDAIQLADFLMPSSHRSPDDTKEIAKKEISSPKYVVMLTKRVVSVLSSGSSSSSDLKEYWGVNALNWATNSQNYRLAQRSYQILRGLEPTTTIDALTDVLTSLGKNLATLSQDNIGLVGEIQETLLVMVRCIHPSKLILFPQLFWGTMALLQSDFESQFINAVKLLSILLETVNFSDRAVQNVFLASMPKEWDFFHGLQPMVLRGLMSTTTSPITVEFLSALTLQPCNEIFHPEPIRFLTNLTSLLPFLLYSTVETDPDHLAYLVSERLATASENHNYPRLSTILQNYSQQLYVNQLDGFLDDLISPLSDVVVKHSTLVFSLLFNVLEFGPPDFRYPILRLLSRLVKGGVNPADTKSSRVADWYDTVTIFINDHKTPSYIVAQCLRFAEISSEKSPTSLTAIDNALMKPSRSAFTNVKKFCNKVDRGTQIASACLSKVLDSCGARNTSLTKSMYFNTQIFEKFFSSTDDMAPPQKPYDTIDDLGSESSSSAPPPGSENDNDGTDTIHSMNDLNSSFDMGDRAEFHNFPNFQGFNDILEGLGDMSTISSTSGVNTSTANKSTILDHHHDLSDSSSNESSSSMSFSSNSSILGMNPPMTPIHSTKSPSSSSLITPTADRSNVNVGGSATFIAAIQEIQSTSALAEKYKKAQDAKPNLNKWFMEQRERAIEVFTTQLNVYTEQRTSTNNTRAKLFENVLAVLIKEKESDLTSKNLQSMLSNSGSSIPIVQQQQTTTTTTTTTNSTPTSSSTNSSTNNSSNNLTGILHQQVSASSPPILSTSHPGLSSPTVLSTPTPITTSPSLSSPTLLDESSRLTGADKRRRSSTRPEPNPKS
ncbi:hypothetical protein DFA_08978 [Cavenderia fasciculata]|uniref:Uncharacterized protein n=1 Tax=Cavenderia fasciculata TaxID=261658 RepID=F4Q6D0_CACFS|nr:uncharacterized protein DFA_08978 [Cavenderia fasciculata]EGG16440.1 hypothetical protein DFA_08978 [Cavenderia fasciculata]|eukprot:XP_004354840.1 hypothetical protein DFA_08978 [Cavenderia fasciculata]